MLLLLAAGDVYAADEPTSEAPAAPMTIDQAVDLLGLQGESGLQGQADLQGEAGLLGEADLLQGEVQGESGLQGESSPPGSPASPSSSATDQGEAAGPPGGMEPAADADASATDPGAPGTTSNSDSTDSSRGPGKRSFGESAPRASTGSRVKRAVNVLSTTPEWLPELVRGGFDDLTSARLDTGRAQIVIALILPLPVLLWLLVSRMVRGAGEIAVQIDYPAEMRGTFSVRLTTRRSEGTRAGRILTPEDAQRAELRGRRSRRTEHHCVSRETQFRRVPAGLWYVTVDGFLQQSESEEVVSTRFEEREARVGRGGTARLSFDLNPRACPVEVRVLWDRRSVQDAQVARWGAPGSMRFARGAVTYTLDAGRHTIVAGSADRVAEMPLHIQSFQPVSISIDLADRDQLLFSGCPPAVEPYLSGDVPAAARALERDGQSEIANALLARFHQEGGQAETAARHFEAAGQHAEAAQLWESLSQFERAGTLYEAAGQDDCAAEMFRAAGKLLQAGDAFARASAYDSAVDCFKRAGDVARWVDALAKKGAMFEAAKVALDQGDRSRAIQLLSEVGVTHPEYPEAAVRLAEAYEHEGHADLAQHKLEELIATRGDEATPIQAFDVLARLCEANGDFERALAVLDKLRARDAAWPNLATRIEELKKRRSASARQPGNLGNDASEEFGEESRYEILDEVGRGGMGVVFKARDRRLGRTVALKRLPDNLRNHPKAIELFLREARAAAALNHPNIVTLFDAGQEHDVYYITMELLEGLPLQRILKTNGQLKPRNVAKLGGQVATGLQYAHEQGIVHRDIKTANLFFTKGKVVKIMDFGLAKMQEEVRRATTVIGGTPYYMAPEQSAGHPVDNRADLYALGVTFWELLTGRVPFKEGDVAFHHRHTAPPDPRENAEGVPDALAELILELMAKKPEDRPESAGAVCARLGRIAREA
jgi:tRNA A-37 threonylcarbamoyl transferase component Bud32/Tfp pilus assembly protein PilF